MNGQNRQRKLRSEKGFTLLEIMIALVIMVVIAAILTQGLPFIEGKVRDGRRLYELNNLQRAIEIYHSDNNTYPISPSYTTFATDNDSSIGTLPAPVQAGTNVYIPNLVPTYFQQLPLDPLPGLSNNAGCQALGYNRNIIYISNGDYYKLIFQCASETDDYDPTSWYYDPNRFNWGWAVSNDINYTSGTLGW